MDRRTKLLVSVFGAIIGCAMFAQVVYPKWIAPLVALGDTIAERKAELLELEERQAEVDWAKKEFRQFVERVGSFDIREVENDLRDRLNGLIEQHGLDEADVTPTRPTRDRKTGLRREVITVNCVGSLESIAMFMRDVSELPHLVRVRSAALYPASGSAKKKRRTKGTRIHLRLPLQVMVLPQHRVPGRMKAEELAQPQSLVRHSGRKYSGIWDRTPFTAYVKLNPLVATIKKPDVKVKQGKRVQLDVVATGGDGDYRYVWEPGTGLDKPKSRRPRLVDTKKAGSHTYTVTVTDGRDTKATTSVVVVIEEKKKRSTQVVSKPPKPAAPKGPQRWKGGKTKQIVMTLISNHGSSRVAEVVLEDSRSKQTDYYAEGADFDSGKLVFVHQTGALVRRHDGYFVYAIGNNLSEDMAVDTALDFPRLQEVAAYLRGVDEAAKKEADAKAKEAVKPATGENSPQAPVENATKGAASGAAKGGTPAQTNSTQKTQVPTARVVTPGGSEGSGKSPTTRKPVAAKKSSGRRGGGSDAGHAGKKPPVSVTPRHGLSGKKSPQASTNGVPPRSKNSGADRSSPHQPGETGDQDGKD